MMVKHVFVYLAVYTLFLQLTRGIVKIFDLIPGYKVATVIFKQKVNLTQKLLLGSNFFKGFFFITSFFAITFVTAYHQTFVNY